MAYLASSGLCIGAIGCLSSQKTARLGNTLGLLGVGGGVAACLGAMGGGPALLAQTVGARPAHGLPFPGRRGMRASAARSLRAAAWSPLPGHDLRPWRRPPSPRPVGGRSVVRAQCSRRGAGRQAAWARARWPGARSRSA